MATMHGKGHGKSGSSPPAVKKKADWVDQSPKEIEEIIVNLANSGQTPSQIGLILRDQYGIPDISIQIGKKIETILGENNLLPDVPRDLLNLIKKSVKLQDHMNSNKKDMSAKRGYILTVSKIRRLSKYYIKKGTLDKNWRYSPEKAALLVK